MTNDALAGVFNDRRIETHDYEGALGNDTHITRSQRGMIPTTAVAGMPGARGEVSW